MKNKNVIKEYKKIYRKIIASQIHLFQRPLKPNHFLKLEAESIKDSILS